MDKNDSIISYNNISSKDMSHVKLAIPSIAEFAVHEDTKEDTEENHIRSSAHIHGQRFSHFDPKLQGKRIRGL